MERKLKKSVKSTKKAPKVSDLDEEKRKRAILKQQHCDAVALHIVGKLIEGAVEEDVFLQTLKYINQCHFQDIVEERAILKNCGYPVCFQKIPDLPNQTFHISTKANKVYDVTDRKNFCSNFCYTASNYIKNQILTSPLWYRDQEEIPKFELLKKNIKVTPGEEIDQGLIKIEKNENETFISTSEFTQNVINEIPDDIRNHESSSEDENEHPMSSNTSKNIQNLPSTSKTEPIQIKNIDFGEVGEIFEKLSLHEEKIQNEKTIENKNSSESSPSEKRVLDEKIVLKISQNEKMVQSEKRALDKKIVIHDSKSLDDKNVSKLNKNVVFEAPKILQNNEVFEVPVVSETPKPVSDNPTEKIVPELPLTNENFFYSKLFSPNLADILNENQKYFEALDTKLNSEKSLNSESCSDLNDSNSEPKLKGILSKNKGKSIKKLKSVSFHSEVEKAKSEQNQNQKSPRIFKKVNPPKKFDEENSLLSKPVVEHKTIFSNNQNLETKAQNESFSQNLETKSQTDTINQNFESTEHDSPKNSNETKIQNIETLSKDFDTKIQFSETKNKDFEPQTQNKDFKNCSEFKKLNSESKSQILESKNQNEFQKSKSQAENRENEKSVSEIENQNSNLKYYDEIQKPKFEDKHSDSKNDSKISNSETNTQKLVPEVSSNNLGGRKEFFLDENAFWEGKDKSDPLQNEPKFQTGNDKKSETENNLKQIELKSKNIQNLKENSQKTSEIVKNSENVLNYKIPNLGCKSDLKNSDYDKKVQDRQTQKIEDQFSKAVIPSSKKFVPKKAEKVSETPKNLNSINPKLKVQKSSDPEISRLFIPKIIPKSPDVGIQNNVENSNSLIPKIRKSENWDPLAQIEKIGLERNLLQSPNYSNAKILALKFHGGPKTDQNLKKIIEKISKKGPEHPQDPKVLKVSKNQKISKKGSKDLKNQNLESKNFENQNFDKGDMKDQNFEKGDIEDQNFEKEDLKDQNFGNDIKDRNFESGDLKDQNFKNLSEGLKKLNLENKEPKNPNFENAGLKKRNFESEDLRNPNFESRDLRKTNFETADLKKQNFECEDLKNQNFESGDLKNPNLENSSKGLKDPKNSSKAPKNQNFESGNLKIKNFGNGDLKNQNFDNTSKDPEDQKNSSEDLKNQNFESGDLKSQNFESEDLENPNFKSGDLKNPNIKNSKNKKSKSSSKGQKNPKLQNPTKKSLNENLEKSKNLGSKNPDFENFLQIFESRISDWFTVETMIFLYGENEVKKVLTEKNFKEYLNLKKDSMEKLIKCRKYEDICKRLNLMEMTDQYYDEKVKENAKKPLPSYNQLKSEAENLDLRVQAFYSGCFEVIEENSQSDYESENESDSENPALDKGVPAVLPLCENKDFLPMRRKVFLSSLNRTVSQICEKFDFDPNVLKTDLNQLVETFNFDSKTIIFKTAQWPIVTLFLIKLLRLKNQDYVKIVDPIFEQDLEEFFVKNVKIENFLLKIT